MTILLSIIRDKLSTVFSIICDKNSKKEGLIDMDTVDRIKELAKKRGWSLQKVAEKAGIGINSIYRWNSKTPSTQSLTKVAKVLDVSTDYLLNGNAEESNKTADLADDETIFTYEGKRIPPEDLEYMKRILRGGKA